MNLNDRTVLLLFSFFFFFVFPRAIPLKYFRKLFPSDLFHTNFELISFLFQKDRIGEETLHEEIAFGGRDNSKNCESLETREGKWKAL